MTGRHSLCAIPITALVLVACSEDETVPSASQGNVPPATSTTPASTSTGLPSAPDASSAPTRTTSDPTSTAAPALPEVEATNDDEQAVIDTATELVEVIEPTILRDPDSDESLIDEWATGQARESAMSDISYTRSQGERLVGDVRLTVLELEVEDDVATVRACLDPLGADYVDTGGESVLLANRYPNIVSMTLVRDVNTRFGWIVTENRAGGVACRE